MKSTYQIDVPGTKIWNLWAKTVPWGVIEVLAPRQKQVDVPPTFFQISIDFLVGFYLFSNISKIWIDLSPFRQDILISHFQQGQKWKKNDILYKTEINQLLKIDTSSFMKKSQKFSFLAMLKVKNGHILPKRKKGDPNF